MKLRMTGLTAAGLALAGLALGAEYLSPVELVADKNGGRLFVAESTAAQIAIVDPASASVTGTIRLPLHPTGLALAADGATLYVTGGGPEGALVAVDVAKQEVAFRVALGHTPMSPVPALDGKTLYACNRFNNDVSIVDLETRKEVARVPVTREPVAMALTPDGASLYVANHLPTGAANVDRMTSAVDVIDTAARKVVASILLPNGAIDLRSLCLSADGKRVYVPSIFARFLVPTTQIERGWINTHALNILDAGQKKLLWTVLLDDVDLGAANPWGIACSSDGRFICVAHAATHEVSLIDEAALLAKLADIPARDTGGMSIGDYEGLSSNPANDLSFLTGIRRRVKLTGNGPRGLAAISNQVAVAEYFSDSLALVTTDSERPVVKSIPLGPEQPMDIVRKGHMYFEDATLCFQQWQSCSTCHPDARTDAVNWDLLNDGIGNPKSTKSLLLAHKTPPAMISGIRDKAETAVRSGFRYILFAMPEEEKSTAIDRYLESLAPMPSPYLQKGRLSPSAEKGRKIFEKAGCKECHKPPLYTDLQSYDVGTGTDREKGMAFDTPTLVECWRTAPYLYDGRAATLKDVFTTFNPDDAHGETSALDAQSLQDLIEFVRSL